MVLNSASIVFVSVSQPEALSNIIKSESVNNFSILLLDIPIHKNIIKYI